MSHTTDSILARQEIAVDHVSDFYRSEREICSYQENRMREDRDERYND